MGFVSSTKLSEYTTKLMTKLRSIFATQNMIGAPKKAATVADMTDTDSIYVYTGSETGYIAGNWYYYDQGSWVSGGIYNAVAFTTDPTLTQPGEAADAKATGDVIGNVFTPAAKRKLIAILRLMDAWKDTVDPPGEVDELEELLFPGGEAVSIDAVFAQSGNVIYDNDDLDVLRQYLTVTAEDAQGVTTTITDYTLTGTLTVGTSTITVTYGNLSDTFTVAVTLNDVRFCEWIQTADDTNWIDTGVVPSNSFGFKYRWTPLFESYGTVGCRQDTGNTRCGIYIEGGKIYAYWGTSNNTQVSWTAGMTFEMALKPAQARSLVRCLVLQREHLTCSVETTLAGIWALHRNSMALSLQAAAMLQKSMYRHTKPATARSACTISCPTRLSATAIPAERRRASRKEVTYEHLSL